MKVPASVQVIDCTGKVIVAGFWNSHVHFETGWQGIAQVPAVQVDTHMREMLTRWGFTTVWDLGSDPNNTLALRRRGIPGKSSGRRFSWREISFLRTATPSTCQLKCSCPRLRVLSKRSRWRGNI